MQFKLHQGIRQFIFNKKSRLIADFFSSGIEN